MSNIVAFAPLTYVVPLNKPIYLSNIAFSSNFFKASFVVIFFSKGAFTYCIITEGDEGGVSKMLMDDYRGGG